MLLPPCVHPARRVARHACDVLLDRPSRAQPVDRQLIALGEALDAVLGLLNDVSRPWFVREDDLVCRAEVDSLAAREHIDDTDARAVLLHEQVLNVEPSLVARL